MIKTPHNCKTFFVVGKITCWGMNDLEPKSPLTMRPLLPNTWFGRYAGGENQWLSIITLCNVCPVERCPSSAESTPFSMKSHLRIYYLTVSLISRQIIMDMIFQLQRNELRHVLESLTALLNSRQLIMDWFFNLQRNKSSRARFVGPSSWSKRTGAVTTWFVQCAQPSFAGCAWSRSQIYTI
jgi:hypothetical protein